MCVRACVLCVCVCVCSLKLCCVQAFIKLESMTDLSEEVKRQIEELSVEIFVKYVRCL